VPISIFKANKNKAEMIDSVTAFNIWNTLRLRYISVESGKYYRNFIHDRDFVILVSEMVNDFQKQVNILEEKAQKYKVKVPERPPSEIKISQKLPSMTDKFIFRRIFSDIVAEMYSLSRSVRTTTTNDKLMEMFVKFFEGHLKNFENLYKFGKIKGWTDIEPAYKSAQTKEKEQVSVSEANHIWDHVNTRYDQIELTNLFLEFVHDPDFKMLLKQGLSRLKDQITMLEKKALKYDIPLPERPPAKVESVIDPEAMEDKFVYRTILTGIQSAIDLHARAVIEAVRNDSVRKMFFDLLKEELNLYGAFLKYGKVKGWTKVVPAYLHS